MWHNKSIEDTLKALNTSEQGLSLQESLRRLETYGQNKLPESKPDGTLLIFIRQFKSPLIYILFAAAGVVFAMGETVDATIIFAVLLLNSFVGTIQEGKAQNTLVALQKFTETDATVVRNGKEIIVSDKDIVPGDIIILQEGEKVPTDARLIFSNSLTIDEASLTGESGPVSKISMVIQNENIPIIERKNMVFKGTHVLSGAGRAVVVATGTSTEIGRIAKQISSIESEIPLKTNIKYLSRAIIITVLAISIALVAAGIFSGRDAKEMFTIAVALSVSIIPEGLPIVMTLILAGGVKRMSKRSVLVKRLQAVEALGQTKIIAVDKTGTLTKNEMVIQKVFTNSKTFDVGGNGYEPKGEILLDGKIVEPLTHEELVFAGKIASFSASAKLAFVEEKGLWKTSGDPTEVAMLSFGRKIGFLEEALEEEAPKILDEPFSYRKKYRMTVRLIDKKRFLSLVGAPEKVISLCDKIKQGEKTASLTEENFRKLESTFYDFARSGFRVVAYAYNENSPEKVSLESLPPLTFGGFFCMADSLREEVKESVKKVVQAGMRLVMITGDHRLTAEAIGREALIYKEGDKILTGEEIDQINDNELENRLSGTSIFARVTPDHKLRIIEAFKRRGEVIAMTGDGVNDAASLVAADLGVAMGKIGTEVAKEAADIVLLNDNFSGIVEAAEEGRGIYKTIKKVILYLFSTSLGEALTIGAALSLGLEPPIIAAQIIWLNFVTDGFLDVALAMEPKGKNLLAGKFEKPRKWIVDNLMFKRMIIMSLPMAIGTLYLFHKYAMIPGGMVKAQTVALTALAVFQWFNAWNSRSEGRSIFQINPFSNIYLVGSTLIVIMLQLLALNAPIMKEVLHTQELALADWVTILPVASSIIFVEEIRKFFYRRKKIS